jgi:hypothetical protein
MKIKVTEKITDYENKPVQNIDQQGNPTGTLTWRQVIFTALNAMESDPNKQMPEEDKMKAYQITKKAFDSEEPDFNIEEAAFILKNIKRVYSPLICGRAEEVFENKK